ncbi:hypothetical protein GGR56DRAFT_684127, partial [Xylariaceae sp. FL0804]
QNPGSHVRDALQQHLRLTLSHRTFSENICQGTSLISTKPAAIGRLATTCRQPDTCSQVFALHLTAPTSSLPISSHIMAPLPVKIRADTLAALTALGVLPPGNGSPNAMPAHLAPPQGVSQELGLLLLELYLELQGRASSESELAPRLWAPGLAGGVVLPFMMPSAQRRLGAAGGEAGAGRFVSYLRPIVVRAALETVRGESESEGEGEGECEGDDEDEYEDEDEDEGEERLPEQELLPQQGSQQPQQGSGDPQQQQQQQQLDGQLDGQLEGQLEEQLEEQPEGQHEEQEQQEAEEQHQQQHQQQGQGRDQEQQKPPQQGTHQSRRALSVAGDDSTPDNDNAAGIVSENVNGGRSMGRNRNNKRTRDVAGLDDDSEDADNSNDQQGKSTDTVLVQTAAGAILAKVLVRWWSI